MLSGKPEVGKEKVKVSILVLCSKMNVKVALLQYTGRNLFRLPVLSAVCVLHLCTPHLPGFFRLPSADTVYLISIIKP